MTYPDAGGDATPRRTPLWLKIVGIGCGGIIVLMLVVAGLVAGNWSRLSGYYRQAKTTFSDVIAVQAALQKKYDGQVRINVKRQSGVQGSILSVTLVNAPLMDRIKIDSAEGRQAALEIATAARDALPPAARYDNYEVVFERASGAGGIGISGGFNYRFTAAELPASAAGGGEAR